MIERIASGFHPFVLPFLFGMLFVLGYCLFGIIRILIQLPHEDRRRFIISLVTPKTLWKNIKDIFLNCLLHVKLWKRNRTLGYMHSSIAFGWFMLIVLGHLEVMLFLPHRIKFFYYPIFFNFFVAEGESTIQGAALFFLMDFFLLIVLSGIVLAMVKRVRSLWFGMRRTTRPSLLDRIGLYSLWAIFPLRLLSETFTAHISGGSFLTLPMNWLFRQFFGNELNYLPTWWAYSIALGIFLCVLPFTRYMHIPAEMMLIPLRNAGLHILHPRKGFARVQFFSCPGCGVCIDACPMSVKKENLKDCTVYLNRQLRRGNEKRIEEISDKCLMCGKCTQVCQVQVDGPQMRLAQRSMRKYGINQHYSRISAEEKIAGLGTGKVLYFAGCMTHLTPGIKKAVCSLLDKAGANWTMMDPDGGLCCGRPMALAGRKEQAREMRRINQEIIKASGCDVLLLSCPICYKIFKEKYELNGIYVVHHSVFINELIHSGRLHVRKDEALKLAYHDPCELGRGCGIYDPPRSAVSAAGTLVEAAQNRDMSICCGGSLGSLSLNYEKRKDITLNSLKNLQAGAPDKIVTACPLCQSTYSKYADVPVEDIAQIIDMLSIN
ncbi:MAG: 4Fe-4S dicluster domain-containing protein [Bacteroidales bacterium]|nr:4Fe-4S dicluster domain-containing protein [Bacteroidales bacterium]